MVKTRILVEQPKSSSILGEAVRFKTSNRVARNRFMKAAMSELIASYSVEPKDSGIPTQRIINIYEKFGNGGFGLVLTGSIFVCHNHIEALGSMAISVEGDCRESRLQFRRLARAGKSGGNLFVAQLNHVTFPPLLTIFNVVRLVVTRPRMSIHVHSTLLMSPLELK